MNHIAYNNAVSLIKRHEEDCDIVGGVSDDEIRTAEEYLELKFPDGLKQYFKDFGALDICSESLSGMIPGSNFVDSMEMDCIWFTKSEREYNMPHNLIALYNADDGELWCLKINNDDPNKNSPMVRFFDGVDLEYQTYEVIAPDFETFLLDTVKSALQAEGIDDESDDELDDEL